MTKNLSLPALRRICGFTQVQLAQLIGVSTRTIVAVENGTRSLTEANATKVMFATGVLKESLLDEDLPRSLDGKPYTKKHWELWRRPETHSYPDGTPTAGSVGDEIKQRFEVLLNAAVDSGRAFLFAEEFRTMLSRLLKDPAIKRRYSEAFPGQSAESFSRQISEFLGFSAWELDEETRLPDLWGDPLGNGYTADDDSEDIDQDD
jgi:DNA-binding XRE family transcriptional regulator